MLTDEAWTAEDQNYLNPPTPKRKSVHTPFREEDEDEEPVFKVPLAPSPKSSPTSKPSIFSKLSSKIEPKPLHENGTVQPPISDNLFGKSAFSGALPLNNIFQSSNDKPSSHPSNNIFGTMSKQQNIFASVKTSDGNLFKAPANNNNTTKMFGSFTSSSPSIFANFTGKPPANNQSSFSDETVKPTSNFSETKTSENDELEELMRQKKELEMEIRQEEEAERLKKEELQKLQRQKETEERMEKERKEKERIEKEKEKANALKRLQRIEQMSTEMAVDIISEFVHEKLETLAEEALDIYQQIESATEDIYCELLAEIIFEESADCERIHQEKIETIESTPIWVPNKPLLELVPDFMHPLQDVTLNMPERYRHGVPTTMNCPATHETLIDLFEIIPQQLNRKSTTIERIRKRPTFWKCGISIPNDMEDKSGPRIEKWLDKLFVRREPVHSKLFFCEQQFVRNVQQDVAISLRKFRGSEMTNEDGNVNESDIIGLNAIVFIISASNPKETRKRILKVIQHKNVNCAIGIVMLNVEKNHEQYLRSELQLDELVTDPQYSIKYFCSKENAPSAPVTRTKLLLKCFIWVASNFKFKSCLEMQTTMSFFDQCLGNQFWHRILTSSTHNPGLFKAATNIGFIIDTYNTALDHLDNLITEDLTNHPVFPQEFKRFVKLVTPDIPVEYQYFPDDWKNPNRLKLLRNFIASLRLQPMSLKTSSLEDIEEQLLAYAHLHIMDKQRSDRAAYRMIKALLEYLRSISDDNDNFQQQIGAFSWIDPVRLLTLEILVFRYEEKGHSIPKEVIYNRHKFKQYHNEPWWLQDNSPMKQVRLSFDCVEDVDEPISKKSKPNDNDKDEIERLMARGADALRSASAKIDKFRTTVNVGREITHELDSLLYEHERNLRVQKRWSQLEMNN